MGKIKLVIISFKVNPFEMIPAGKLNQTMDAIIETLPVKIPLTAGDRGAVIKRASENFFKLMSVGAPIWKPSDRYMNADMPFILIDTFFEEQLMVKKTLEWEKAYDIIIAV